MLARTTAAGLAIGVGRAQPVNSNDSELVRLDQMTVRGESVPGWPDAAPGTSQGSASLNLAAAIETLPGLAMHHMGAAAAEPLLRGLGSDRVVTTLDGLPLPNASPTRTAASLALIAAGLPATVEVSKSLPSVTLGPPANAGYIELALGGAHRPTGSPMTSVVTAWNADRRGAAALVDETAVLGAWSVRAAAAAHSLGDYTAGDGTVVPASDRNVGAALHFDWQPDSQRRLALGALFSRQQLAVNSALPLDTRDTNTNAVTASYSQAVSDQTTIDSHLGVGITKPHLDNAGRPAPAAITADGRMLSLAAGFAVQRKSAGGEITVGFDATQEDRRLERKRPGAVDLLWPDLRQTDVGGFAELVRALTPDWKIRLGARLDAASSAARATDGLAFNRTIRDLYVAYNGPAADHVTRRDVAGAANFLVTGELAPSLTTSFGAGFSRQPPGASERYRAFSDALGGGYEIGNPTAGAENKYELDGSLKWHQRNLTAQLDLFGDYLPNYLHRSRVGITTPPPPPAPGAIVYGFRSTEAVFWGGELELAWQPIADAWWRLTAASVTGIDRTARRRLAEIPPATLALTAGRVWPGTPLQPWIEIGGRAAAAQHNPAPDEMPVFADTSAFILGTVRGGFAWRRLRLVVSIENVFNRLYYEYLSPPASTAPPSGSLLPGARIPGPGRTFTLTISCGLP